MQRWARAGEWAQLDPSHATVTEVITEIITATDNAVFSGCTMIGEIKELVINDVPDWLVLCDGTEYADTDYPELWAVIHDNLKTDATHFRVPQRARRVAWGETVGAQEGEETHTLITNEMPAHVHVDTTTGITAADPIAGVPLPAASPATASTTGSTGGDGAHNNIQPMEGAQFYIVASTPQAG